MAGGGACPPDVMFSDDDRRRGLDALPHHERCEDDAFSEDGEEDGDEGREVLRKSEYNTLLQDDDAVRGGGGGGGGSTPPGAGPLATDACRMHTVSQAGRCRLEPE